MPKPLRIIFAGTPEFAAQHLQALLNTEHQVVAAYTQPDRPAGRGKKLMPSPVKGLAEAHQIPVYQPVNLKLADDQQQIAALQADIMVVVAYGLLLPQAVLEMPRLGCINVHGSLLPAWRGAAPIQRALWAGDKHTGITIMQMDKGLDTGEMLYRLSCPIEPQDTSASLYHKLATLGPEALLITLNQLSEGIAVREKQNNEQASYAQKLSKEEAKLDWSLSAVQLERCIRAFNPWPASYFMIDGKPVKVWQAEVLPHHPGVAGTIIRADKQGIAVITAEGVLSMQLLQPAGKKTMTCQDLLNSRQQWFLPGNVLA